MGTFSEKRAKEGEYAYKIFAELIKKDEGSYATEIADIIGKGGSEEATRALNRMEDMGILKKNRKGRAQYYQPDWKSIINQIQDLFESQPHLPQNFIEHYTSNYVQLNQSSTIQRMFREDLVTEIRAFRHYKDDLPDFLEDFLNELGAEADLYDRRTYEVLETAIEKTLSDQK
jgi:predicted transcriptional regulator